MKLLALDCAAGACSCAVLEDGVVRAARFEMMGRGQAERLTPMAVETLAACGWAHADLDAYAVTVGPGAFTGVRVGLATAKAMALAAGKPLIGVTTPAALAWPLFAGDEKPPGPVVCFLKAGRADLYVQIFEAADSPPGFRAAGEITAHMAGDAASWMPKGAWASGNAFDDVRAGLDGRSDVVFRIDSETGGQPDARAVAGLAEADTAGRRLPAAMPTPVYLHSHYAKKPKDNSVKA